MKVISTQKNKSVLGGIWGIRKGGKVLVILKELTK